MRMRTWFQLYKSMLVFTTLLVFHMLISASTAKNGEKSALQPYHGNLNTNFQNSVESFYLCLRQVSLKVLRWNTVCGVR